LSGEADLQVNFERWRLSTDSVIILFPGDVVQVEQGENFCARLLCYDTALLREASLQMEHTVYALLRADRCRGDKPIVAAIVKNMMNLLEVFFSQPNCRCLEQMVLLQLKAFFLGFSDFLQRNPLRRPQELGSDRINGLFSEFMRLVAEHYREQREVAFYASELHISPKYLGQIVSKKTGRNPKTIIDHYVVVQLKLQLRTSRITIKELSWLYHFSDTSFFCRYFKSHTGLSPQEYRKSGVAD
jgi:AraC-like DNA-binding protein